MCAPYDMYNYAAINDEETSDTESLLGSQLTGREFGGSVYTGSPISPGLHFPSSGISITDSTVSRDRPTTLLRSSETLVSVTSGSKPPSEKSNISLTPPAQSVKHRGSHLYTTKKLVLGLLIIVLISLSWVGSTQTAKSSFSSGSSKNKSFKAPFFVMWFGTAWMMAVYPLSCVVFFVLHRDKWSWAAVLALWR